MTSILNPIIPFCVSLPGNKLNTGHDVVVGGEAFYGAQRFSINFIQSSSQTRLFHLDFRFDQNETVLNSNYPDGCWAQEERTPLPLILGKKFNIEIKFSADRFVIIVDFQYHCDFVYRFDMSEADALLIEGDVNINSIQFN
ncbi:hypothetical protein DAPPUDRAFT_224569 [Daphnia pulex]|uniref:Galectin n=1 Tax=Daphnia pulex TaxID=6669 RepID=E9GIJ7_DAPPU|nr:hypothetical protein DAPPUDRAFT_224569 [Daphnia pulex]|eukprot:EFX80743.1 hypothetical protein DAPPUDRAFT_224569 [Daphnia pulex]